MQDNVVCCKNESIGGGVSILASENAIRRVFKFKSFAEGDGIEINDSGNVITLSRKDDTIFLKKNHNNEEFSDANIILSYGVTISNCTFKGKSSISGYGTIKNCIFMDETAINVHEIHYTTDCKFYDTTLYADKITIEGCTLRKVSSIKCNELKMKTSSIISQKISIHANYIVCEESVINSSDTFINCNYLNTSSYTSPTFEGKLLKLHCDYIECKAKLCSVKEVNIISTLLNCSTNYFNIDAKVVKMACDIKGTMSLSAETVIINSSCVELNSCKWNITNGSIHLVINKLRCYGFNIKAVDSCINCNIFDAIISDKLIDINGGSSHITIDRLQIDSSLVEMENTTYTCLGGNWSTTSDNLVIIGKNNTNMQLLPSFLESSKAPFYASEYTKIKTLPTISNKGSIGVSHIPPQNFSIVV